MRDANAFPVELLKLPALSIRQPWAWFILNAGKDVENRNWATQFRGRFLIHAAKGCTRDEYEDAVIFAAEECGLAWGTQPSFGDPERGGIVGVAELVDCVKRSESPWFVGKYGFVLRNAQPLPFLPCRGALGFFRVGDVNRPKSIRVDGAGGMLSGLEVVA